MKIERETLRKMLSDATKCEIQHDGWPCGTCFFSVSKKLNNQDWQALLLFRGDYEEKMLDNLPKSPMKSIRKLYGILRKDK